MFSIIFINQQLIIEYMNEYITLGIDFLKDVFSGLINKVILATIILMSGFIIGKVFSKIISKILKEFNINKIIYDISGIKYEIEEIITHFVLYFTYFISIIIALKQLGIATEVLNILSSVIIILIGIFVLLSVKDFIPNIISGIIIYQKKTFKKGDEIEFKNIIGTVSEITLLDTRLKTKKGDIIIIPNVNLTKNEIIKKKNKK
jgi:small conductance mechanosensitive channel